MSIFLIETNQQCNFSCKYCFYNEFGRSASFLSRKQLENIFQNVKNAEFYLTGGEPFLNPEIADMIEYLSAKGTVSVFTNASLLDDKIIKKILPFIDMFFVSLDGFDFENSERGHTTEILRKLDLLLTYTKNITVKTCLYGQPIEKYKEFVETLSSMGIENFSINIIKKHYDSVAGKKQLKEILEWIISKGEMFQTGYIKALYNYYIFGKMPPTETCLTGKDFFYVYANGKVVGCPDNKEDYVGSEKKKCFHSGCIPFWEFFAK